MAITTNDGLIAAWGSSFTTLTFFKQTAPQTVGSYSSLFVANGMPGLNNVSAGTINGATRTHADVGAYDLTNPVDPIEQYLATVDAWSTQPGTLFIYDRLWDNAAISPTLTSAQVITFSGLPSRCAPVAGGLTPDALGFQVEPWVENFTIMGAGVPTMTLIYTSSAGTATRTATLVTPIVTAGAITRTYPFLLQAGDKGARSLQSLQLSATMTTGTLRLVMRRLLAVVPLTIGATGSAITLGPFDLGLPQVHDSSCLELVWCAHTTSPGQLGANLGLVRG